MIHLTSVYTERGVLPGAIEFLYELLLERPREANITHKKDPKYVQHMVFVKAKPYWRWWLLQDRKTWVGSLYVTDRNELGIFIKKDHFRKGYAREALRVLRATITPLGAVIGVRPSYFVANVAPDNAASHALFLDAGGVVIQQTYRL